VGIRDSVEKFNTFSEEKTHFQAISASGILFRSGSSIIKQLKKVAMKKISIIAALFICASGVITANANTTARRSETSVRFDEKVKIKKEDLPEAVRTALAGNDYNGWEISEAYQYKEAGTYEVELKKGEEKKTVKLDKDGKVIG
jgi:hypothetical protein